MGIWGPGKDEVVEKAETRGGLCLVGCGGARSRGRHGGELSESGREGGGRLGEGAGIQTSHIFSNPSLFAPTIELSIKLYQLTHIQSADTLPRD